MEKALTQMNELEEKIQGYQKKYKIQEQKLEAQAEENEAQSVKISEQSAVITGLQTPICTKLFGIDSRDQTEMDTCFYCIVILNQIDCDKDSKCEFNDGICRPMMGAGK
ncbi:uncharacterized protein LOC130047006 [Ostrea edulis]|uniref:uncharacterized protein LOC130047006 n=1 Tax=Ostrea edulis TaxID=37623 RepID=UPI0024AF06BA|nr:uncharacterized protein LOC130047006 [Ostrea edulis]